jgi:hypothetical protein
MKSIAFYLSVFCMSLSLSGQAYAQFESPVSWDYAFHLKEKQEASVTITATLQPGWHLFSQNLKAGGPTPTSIQFSPMKGIVWLGKPIEPAAKTVYEKLFKMDIAYFENRVDFQQHLRFKTLPSALTGKIEFMVCSKKECLPPDEVAFSIPILSKK